MSAPTGARRHIAVDKIVTVTGLAGITRGRLLVDTAGNAALFGDAKRGAPLLRTFTVTSETRRFAFSQGYTETTEAGDVKYRIIGGCSTCAGYEPSAALQARWPR